MDKIEADVPILFGAKQKYEKCKYKQDFFGQLSCRLYFYSFDNGFDILHHCASCKVNTKKPTTSKSVRS